MQTVNIHEAKTQLSRLVDEAAKGNAFIIAKAGKPMVKVLPISEEELEGSEKRLGFMSGEISVPDDFDSLGEAEIIQLFEGKSS
jgi:prevent-host-death family protein